MPKRAEYTPPPLLPPPHLPSPDERRRTMVKEQNLTPPEVLIRGPLSNDTVSYHSHSRYAGMIAIIGAECANREKAPAAPRTLPGPTAGYQGHLTDG
ncbi:hypothetical protein SKAU_G00326930 [Synaphobranchus kaupii]|uniref:Uncharacterized protein n=1 Tax=Synaphobranchus kaupii TaxID=118154 RepID=A0A9Q1IJE1_SYNKA|nr:hypothetical protein SKAU_G00326930 [Synaphobranchus kaupii]